MAGLNSNHSERHHERDRHDGHGKHDPKPSAPIRIDDHVAGTQAPGRMPYLLEDSAGSGTWQGKPIFNRDQAIGQLDTGAKLEGRTISFGFLETLPKAGGDVPGEYAGFSPMSAAQREGARIGMALWDDLVPLRFVEKHGNGGSADIVLANTTTGPEIAWAGYPSSDGDARTPQSSVWFNPDPGAGNGAIGYGQFGSYTMIHELGHSLGLSHPGSYNNGADDDGDGVEDPITYDADAVYAQDNQQFTVMSYFADEETGGGETWNSALTLIGTPQTPLLHDVLAIQEKYGADPTTRCGDTVYFANSNAGNGVYDLAENPFPYLCVYDAGGNDTFDFSTANKGVFIDLRGGSFSSASKGYLTLEEANALREEVNFDAPPWEAAGYQGWLDFVLGRNLGKVEADTGVAGVDAPIVRNVSIAYNTIIENAIGGSERDYLVGNEVANTLKGNAGNDVLNGLGGNDTLWGGAGADEFRFFADSGIDTIRDFASGKDKINLAEIDADTRAAGDQAFRFIGAHGFSHTAGELRSYVSGGGHFLAGDADGDGLADFVIGLGAVSVLQSDLFL
jgi:serralysin